MKKIKYKGHVYIRADVKGEVTEKGRRLFRLFKSNFSHQATSMFSMSLYAFANDLAELKEESLAEDVRKSYQAFDNAKYNLFKQLQRAVPIAIRLEQGK